MYERNESGYGYSRRARRDGAVHDVVLMMWHQKTRAAGITYGEASQALYGNETGMRKAQTDLERSLGAIFLDRDGTLNRKAAEGEYIRAPEELELLPGAADAVRRINTAGIPAILVTNQRWLAGPAANLAAYADVESRLTQLLAVDGAKLDGSYTCPHALNSCDCRKPEPGLFFRAMRDFPVSLSASCVIGDSLSDARAGRAAGALAVLIAGGPGDHIGSAADFVAFDIGRAVDWAIDAVLHDG